MSHLPPTLAAGVDRKAVSIMHLAIDPGNHQSAYALVDDGYAPRSFGKIDNSDLATQLPGMLAEVTHLSIEQIGHYGTGMPAGREVFDTCRWIGRYEQISEQSGVPAEMVLRPTIKTHLCGTPRAKDSNVIQALIDRFAPGCPNRGKGYKASPGWFYGFRADIWQSYALAVFTIDKERNIA